MSKSPPIAVAEPIDQAEPQAEVVIPFAQRLQHDGPYTSARENLTRLEATAVDLRGQLTKHRLRPRRVASPAVTAMVVGMPLDPAESERLYFDPAQFADVEAKLKTTERAIALQTKIVADARHDASVRICQEAAPEHRQMLLAIIGGTEELVRLAIAEREWREALDRSGVQVCWPIDGAVLFPLDALVRLRNFAEAARESGLV